MALEPVNSVEFADGVLSWTVVADGSAERINESDFIFVLRSADTTKTQHEFVICCLSDTTTETPESPYRIRFLTTSNLPEHLLRHHVIIASLPPHLSMSSNNRVDVIVSVKSGTNLSLPFWETVLQPLLALSREVLLGEQDHAPQDDGEPHVIVTQSTHSVRQYARALKPLPAQGERLGGAASSTRTIILLSGDGGVVDLLNGRQEADPNNADAPADTGIAAAPVIALLPLGTGNALFHSLHKPVASASSASSPLVLALRTLFQGSPAKLPIFRASFSPGARMTSLDGVSESGTAGDDPEAPTKQQDVPVEYLQGAIVASYGFHASVVYESDTPEYRVHGAKRFGMVAQDLLRESHPYSAHVDIRRAGSTATSAAAAGPASESSSQGQEFERIPRDAHAYVLTTLVSNLERTFCISPASEPLDGRLRLVHFGNIGGERTMAAMMAAYDGGKHIGMRWDDGDGASEIGYEQVEEVRVTALEEEPRWRKVCVDGTIVEIPQGGHMSVTTNTDGGFQVLVDPSVIKA